jgi:large subunit ribosomal protein L10
LADFLKILPNLWWLYAGYFSREVLKSTLILSFIWEKAVEKSKKPEVIERIRRSFEESEAVFVINQNKMTVEKTEDLRRQLKSAAATYFVCKNTLARLAVKNTTFECILPHLCGQTALVFSKNLTGSSKVIQEYAAKSEDKIVIVCGGYNGRLLSVAEVKILSQLPSMDELRAKIIAIIQTPAQRTAAVLQAPAGQIARVLKAHSDKNN